MKENRSKKRERERESRREKVGKVEGAEAAVERKTRRGKVRRKRGKRTVVEKRWQRSHSEREGACGDRNAVNAVLARRPWVESKAAKTTGKRKVRVQGVSSRRGDHRRGRWRRQEARKRSEKSGVALWKGRTVERRAASGAVTEVPSGVVAQRDQVHKLAKQR